MPKKPNKKKLAAYSKKLKQTIKKTPTKPKMKPVAKKKKAAPQGQRKLGLTIRGGSARNTGGKK